MNLCVYNGSIIFCFKWLDFHLTSLQLEDEGNFGWCLEEISSYQLRGMSSYGPSSLCSEGLYTCKSTWRIKITCHIKTSLPFLLSLKLTAGLIFFLGTCN